MDWQELLWKMCLWCDCGQMLPSNNLSLCPLWSLNLWAHPPAQAMKFTTLLTVKQLHSDTHWYLGGVGRRCCHDFHSWETALWPFEEDLMPRPVYRVNTTKQKVLSKLLCMSHLITPFLWISPECFSSSSWQPFHAVVLLCATDLTFLLT